MKRSSFERKFRRSLVVSLGAMTCFPMANLKAMEAVDNQEPIGDDELHKMMFALNKEDEKFLNDPLAEKEVLKWDGTSPLLYELVNVTKLNKKRKLWEVDAGSLAEALNEWVHLQGSDHINVRNLKRIHSGVYEFVIYHDNMPLMGPLTIMARPTVNKSALESWLILPPGHGLDLKDWGLDSIPDKKLMNIGEDALSKGDVLAKKAWKNWLNRAFAAFAGDFVKSNDYVHYMINSEKNFLIEKRIILDGKKSILFLDGKKDFLKDELLPKVSVRWKQLGVDTDKLEKKLKLVKDEDALKTVIDALDDVIKSHPKRKHSFFNAHEQSVFDWIVAQNRGDEYSLVLDDPSEDDLNLAIEKLNKEFDMRQNYATTFKKVADDYTKIRETRLRNYIGATSENLDPVSIASKEVAKDYENLQDEWFKETCSNKNEELGTKNTLRSLYQRIYENEKKLEQSNSKEGGNVDNDTRRKIEDDKATAKLLLKIMKNYKIPWRGVDRAGGLVEFDEDPIEDNVPIPEGFEIPWEHDVEEESQKLDRNKRVMQHNDKENDTQLRNQTENENKQETGIVPYQHRDMYNVYNMQVDKRVLDALKENDKQKKIETGLADELAKQTIENAQDALKENDTLRNQPENENKQETGIVPLYKKSTELQQITNPQQPQADSEALSVVFREILKQVKKEQDNRLKGAEKLADVFTRREKINGLDALKENDKQKKQKEILKKVFRNVDDAKRAFIQRDALAKFKNNTDQLKQEENTKKDS